MSSAIYLILYDQLCLSVLSDNCQKWDSSKLTSGTLNVLEFTLKGESGRGLPLCCAVSRSSFTHLLGYRMLWSSLPHHHASSHIYFHILLCWWWSKESSRVFCHLSQKSCNSQVTSHFTSYQGILPNEIFPCGFTLVYHLIECHSTHAIQGFRELEKRGWFYLHLWLIRRDQKISVGLTRNTLDYQSVPYPWLPLFATNCWGAYQNEGNEIFRDLRVKMMPSPKGSTLGPQSYLWDIIFIILVEGLQEGWHS